MITLALQSHYGVHEKAPLIRALEDIHLYEKPLPVAASLDGSVVPINTQFIGDELDSQSNALKNIIGELGWIEVVNIMENNMFVEFNTLDKIINLTESSLSASIALMQDNFTRISNAVVKICNFILEYITAKFSVITEVITYFTRLVKYGASQMLNLVGRLISKAIIPIFTTLRELFTKSLSKATFNVFSSLGYFAHLKWKGVEGIELSCKEFLLFTTFLKHDRAIVLNEYGVEKAIDYETNALQHCASKMDEIGDEVRASSPPSILSNLLSDINLTVEWIFNQCVRFVTFVWKMTTTSITVLMDNISQLVLLGGYTLDPLVKLAQNALKVNNDMLIQLHRENFIMPKVNLYEESKKASQLMVNLKKFTRGTGIPDDVKAISRSGYSTLKNASKLLDLQKSTVPYMDARRLLQRNIDAAKILANIENTTNVKQLISDVNLYRKNYEEENPEQFIELFVVAHEHAKKCFLLAYNRMIAYTLGTSEQYAQFVKGGKDVTVNEHLDQKTAGEFQKSITQSKYTLKMLTSYLKHLEVTFVVQMQALRASVNRLKPDDEDDFTAMTMEIIARVTREMGKRRKYMSSDTKALILDNAGLNMYGKFSSEVLLGDYNKKIAEAYNIASKYTILREEITRRSESGRFVKDIIPKVIITILSGYVIYRYLMWSDIWSSSSTDTMALQIYENDAFAYGHNYSPVYAGAERIVEEVRDDFAELSGGWYPVEDDLKLSKIHHYFLKITNPVTAIAYAGPAASYAAVIAGIGLSTVWLGVHVYSFLQVATNSLVDIAVTRLSIRSLDTYERHTANKKKMWIDVTAKLSMASVALVAAFGGLFLRRAQMIEATLTAVTGIVSTALSLGPLGLFWGVGSILKSFSSGALSQHAKDAIEALRKINITDETIAPFFRRIEGLYDPDKETDTPTPIQMLVTGYNTMILPKVTEVVKRSIQEKKRFALEYNEQKKGRLLIKNE